jgi:hypothetical protein
MKYLKAFIKQENTYRKLFNRKLYDATNLSEKDCQALLDIIDIRLSPENLSCDGELRGAELAHKARVFYNIRDDLEIYAIEHHYSIISADY